MTGLITVVLLTAVACSDGGGVSTNAFVNSVNSVCTTMAASLAAIPAGATPEVYAAAASPIYETNLAALKRLAVPSGQSAAVTGASSLVANLDAELSALDAITAAAGTGDTATVAAKVAEFDALVAANRASATSLGAPACAGERTFAEVAPTTLPTTLPPVTNPPVTTPPATEPPATEPPVEGTNKRYVAIAASIAPNGGFTFGDASDTLAQTFTVVLDVAPTIGAQPGRVAAVEVFQGEGNPVARVFVFLPDTPMSVDAVTELAALLAGENVLSPATVGGLPGQLYFPADGGASFVGSNSADTAGFIVWAVGNDQQSVDVSLAAFITGLNG
jgi:hypothetical protein